MLARGLTEAGMVLRLTRDLRSFLASPITGAQAVDSVRRQLKARSERFVEMVETSILGHPRSPYRWLLRVAGCELGDIRALVKAEGLDGALQRLCEAGVYVAFDEFKGREDIVRGSQRLSVSAGDFDPPRASAHMEIRTGGSRGAATPLKLNFAFIADKALQSALAFEAHGLQEHDKALWLVAGLRHLLQYSKAGHVPIAWFYPVAPLSLRSRVLGAYLSVLGRFLGAALPRPVFLDLKDTERMARWLADRARRGRPVCLTTYGSSVVRICDAATKSGIDLAGVAFMTIGEPYTVARRKIIRDSGATGLPAYAFNEAGTLGFGCCEPQAPDDMHLLSSTYGLIQRPRAIGQSGLTVDALLVTSLLTSGPKVLLNTESGDYCAMLRRSCHCLYGTLGLDTHLMHIRSFEKLTVEGMTFVKTDLLRILEEIMPARFGGVSTDYQLVEEPRPGGLYGLILTVSPHVGAVDDDLLRQTFLEEIARDGRSSKLMAGAWARADAVTVRRADPIVTKAGKILPLHLVTGAAEE
jgi:hypothetical protein